MKFYKVGLDCAILLSVFLQVLIGCLFLLEALFPGRFSIHWTKGFYAYLSIAFLSLAGFLSLFLVKSQKRGVLTVGLKAKLVDIECAIIQEYVKKYFLEAFQIQPKVIIEIGSKGVLEITLEDVKIDKLEIFDKLEKDLGQIFGVKLGYFKPFQIHFLSAG
jgi:hypothetical protein